MNPSAPAMSTPDPRPEGRSLPLVVRYLDLAVIPVALVVFLLGDLPLISWAVSSAIWVIQRFVAAFIERRADASNDVKVVAALMTGSAVGRGFAVVLTIFALGAGDHERGLTAALLLLALFSVYFFIQLLTRATPTR
jgi:hypothetical protein